MYISKKITIFAMCVATAFAKVQDPVKDPVCKLVNECKVINSANGFSKAVADGEKGACMKTCITSITDEVVASPEKHCRKEWANCCVAACFPN